MRARIKPARWSATISMVVGAVFVGIGLFFVIPGTSETGVAWFGVLWTGVALVSTIYSAANVFSERGIAHEEIDFDRGSGRSMAGPESVEDRLKTLSDLRSNGLITEGEFASKREQILKEL